MDFGKLTDKELINFDFTLPADGLQTSLTLGDGVKSSNLGFFVGCAKWGRKEWVGLMYPPKTKDALFLNEYVKHFNSIELNATFYNLPKVDQIEGWKEKAEENNKEGFIFCPKFSRVISHLKRLKNAENETDLFLEGISEFKNYLGPCFLQLSHNFGPKNLILLQEYLAKLPEDLKVFVEIRHKAWFSDPAAKADLFNLFSKLKKGAVITDVSGRRDCLHMELTTKEAFIRFVGNGRKHKDSDFKRIDDWVIRLKKWIDLGLENVYFFLHQHDEKDTPILAKYTIEQFNLHLGSEIADVQIIRKVSKPKARKNKKVKSESIR